MFNYTNYPTVDVSYSVTSDINVTPSQVNSEDIQEQSSKSISTLDEQSSPQLISHKEVLNMYEITSKATIYKWRQNRGFPDPVTLMPLRWLRSAVEEWKENVGSVGGDDGKRPRGRFCNALLRGERRNTKASAQP